MIDRTKNHVYIVTVHYWIINGEGVWKKQSKTFTSIHGFQTKQFNDFLSRRMSEIKGFQKFDEDKMEQYTVPLSDFCQ